MSLINVDLNALATGAADYLASLYVSNDSNPGIALLFYDSSFVDIMGTNTSCRKIADLDWQAFHEGGVYNKENNSVYTSSNFVSLADNINVTVLSLETIPQSSTPPMQVCSLSDVKQHPETGDLWFSDPEFFVMVLFRLTVSSSPPTTSHCMSDTGARESNWDLSRSATISAYDIIANKRLEDKCLFAFADKGIPDGVRTDTNGNVWAGCDDGMHIWNPEDILVGKIYLTETSNNFAFAPGKAFVKKSTP
ncbi:hypothetical protein PHPALM_27837 [Phytophthora palmivora]|uniref:SMP-30/Gluconolactonase/LRE-like region domain-containing protein n=1 Tax=Phytophthora palmivora TaxID=4796 RepID=A0A2P4XBL5_9STRA|nr:hypothetical protein PHPALM_27837 [Phytophthora palmivora]